jgi:hypothetical protein
MCSRETLKKGLWGGSRGKSTVEAREAKKEEAGEEVEVEEAASCRTSRMWRVAGGEERGAKSQQQQQQGSCPHQRLLWLRRPAEQAQCPEAQEPGPCRLWPPLQGLPCWCLEQEGAAPSPSRS